MAELLDEIVDVCIILKRKKTTEPDSGENMLKTMWNFLKVMATALEVFIMLSRIPKFWDER